MHGSPYPSPPDPAIQFGFDIGLVSYLSSKFDDILCKREIHSRKLGYIRVHRA